MLCQTRFVCVLCHVALGVLPALPALLRRVGCRALLLDVAFAMGDTVPAGLSVLTLYQVRRVGL